MGVATRDGPDKRDVGRNFCTFIPRLKIECKEENIDPGSHQKLHPTRARKTLQHPVKKYTFNSAESVENS